MSPFKKVAFAFIALVVMAGLFGAAVQPVSAAATCSKFHTVKSGEYLVMIARMYGTDWLTLADLNDLEDPSLIYSGQKICLPANARPVTNTDSNSGSTSTPVPSSTSTSTNVYAEKVVEDKEVTLRGANLAASTRYTLYMSKYNGTALSTVRVGSVSTDSSGSFRVTYRIPPRMVDVQMVKILLVSSNGTSYSNWFFNVTANKDTGGIQKNPMSIEIVEVEEDDFVTIRLKNAPADTQFKVRIGKANDNGASGTVVDTIDTDDGGKIKLTFDIPENMHDRSKLAIRFENSKNYYTYLEFENEDTD